MDCYVATIKLSEDGEDLLIDCLKPNEQSEENLKAAEAHDASHGVKPGLMNQLK